MLMMYLGSFCVYTSTFTRGAKWFLKAVKSPSFRFELAPRLEGAGIQFLIQKLVLIIIGRIIV